ncbi:MAG TPA: hypothetical protein VFI17_06205 [Solirubrobacterales bacterium]|nr:hypothetical protein [Solirubrobacterales bacterium]
MTRNIKALSLALIAVLAMGAWIASAAQATPVLTLKDSKGETANSATFTGEQTEGEHNLAIEGSNLRCESVELSGNITDADKYTTITPKYSGCTAFGFSEATVNTSNCFYKLIPNAETSADSFSGEIEVFCNTGSIIISAGGVCEAKINSGTKITTGLTLTNVTGLEREHLKFHDVNSSIATEKTKDGTGCPFNGTGNTTATWNGHSTMKAYATGTGHNGANQVNLTVSVPKEAAPTIQLKTQSGNTANSATFTGEEAAGKHRFTVDGNNVECNNVLFSGNMTDGETTTTVTPAYTECTAFAFLGSNVNTENCDYKLMANAETSSMVFSDQVEVFCNSGAIVINAGGVCEAKINSGTVINTGVNTTVETNSPEDLLLHNVETEVPVEKTKDGFGCPFNGTGNTIGKYNGTTTVRAWATGTSHNSANQINLTFQ